jgi:hypothetical protein
MQALSLTADISKLPNDSSALHGIRAAARGVWGKKSLQIENRSLAVPIELRLQTTDRTESLEALARKVHIRTVDGARPSIDNAQLEDGWLVWRSELPDCEIEIDANSSLQTLIVSRPELGEAGTQVRTLNESRFLMQSDSRSRRLHARIPLGATEVFFVTGDSGKKIVLEKSTLSWGALPVAEEGSRQALNKSRVSIPAEGLASARLRALGELLRTIVGGIWVVGCFTLVGIPLVRLAGLQGSRSETLTLAFVFSISVGLCVTVTLGLAGLSLGTSAKLFWIVGLSSALWVMFRQRFSARSFGPISLMGGTSVRNDIVPLSVISVACACAMFIPGVLNPGAFFGHNYTDTYWYLNVATDLWNTAPHTFSADLWKMQRLGDIASMSIVRSLGADSSVSAYQYVAVAVTLVLPWVVYGIAARLSNDRGFALTSAIVGGTSAAVMALYTQCYLAQYLMTHFIMFGFLVGLVLLESDLARPVRSLLFQIVLYAAVLGAGFALYPYVQMVPIAFVVALFLRRSIPVRQKFSIALLLAVATVVWSNLSLRTLLGASGNSQYTEALNGIARYHVFPFYNSVEVLARALGFKDWVLNSRYLTSIVEVFVGAVSSSIESSWAVISTAIDWLSLCVFVSWGVLSVSSISRRSKQALLTVTFVSIAVLSLTFFAAGQLYFYGKILFSLGALLSCLSLLLVQRWPALWMPASLLFVALNCCVSFIDLAPLYLSGDSPLVAKMRTHTDVLNADMRTISQAVEERRAKSMARNPPSLVVVGRWDRLAGTDKDRVALWYLREALRGSRLFFTEKINPGGGLWYGYESSVPMDRVEGFINSGVVDLVLVCPGYELSEGLSRLLRPKSQNSWGKLYVHRGAGS